MFYVISFYFVVISVVLCKKLILFIHPEKTATLITFGKSIDNNLPHQISDREPHLQVSNFKK